MEKRSNKGKIFAIIALVMLVGVVGFLLVYSLNGEKRAEKRLNKLAKSFYSYYYKDNSDKEDKDKIKVFLSKYAASGLTVRLKDMKIYVDTKRVQDYRALKNCDEEKTKVTIYPKTPYGKDDFTIKTTMSCKK